MDGDGWEQLDNFSEEDELDEDYPEDEYDDGLICECGRPATDICTLCGVPMCYMCFEMSGGVCDRHGR